MTCILACLGANQSAHCGCKDKARQMDRWGVVGCRQNRGRIVKWLRRKVFKTWITESIAIGWSMSRESWFRLDDPLGSLADHAIDLAEQSQQQPASTPAGG